MKIGDVERSDRRWNIYSNSRVFLWSDINTIWPKKTLVFYLIPIPQINHLHKSNKTNSHKFPPFIIYFPLNYLRYFFGFIMVVICFIFIFQDCFLCSAYPDNQLLKIIYYCFFPSMFNVGWAAMQVSHMSMVPCLSGCQVKR